MRTCITLVAGQSYADPFTFYDAADALVSLVGATATMTFTDPQWGTTLLALSSAGGTLAMGGAHCMRNLQLLTPEEHFAKTAIDLRNIAEFRKGANVPRLAS